MNKEHTEHLLNTYPELFKHRENLQASLMGFGFECDDGWFELIDNLCRDITNWYLENETRHYSEDYETYEIKKGIPPQFFVTQVKEKFGGLRFYIGGAPMEIHDMITEAEEKSYKICEICGKPGKLYSDRPWWRTLCNDCKKKEESKLNQKLKNLTKKRSSTESG